MNIVIIRSNPVKPDSRVEKEAWTLMNAGHKVRILAWDRESDHKPIDGNIMVLGCEIPITWLGHKAGYAEGMKSLKSFLKFQISMRKWLKKNSSEYDVVHACDYDTAILSYGIVKRRHKKFVFDIFDMLFSNPKSILQKIVYSLQIHVINKADATIICTEERSSQIKGSTPRNLIVIHNTPIEEQKNTDVDLCLSANAEVTKLVYVGILQDNDRLLREIAECCSERSDVEFHVAGFGQLEEYFSFMAEKYKNIIFYGKVPYDVGLSLEEQCDIMMAVYNPVSENNRNAAPNKFYEALMLGKPLLITKEMIMGKTIESNRIGVLVDYSKKGFEVALDELISRKNEWRDMHDRMQKLYHDVYNWDAMAERLSNMYNQLLSN